MGGIAMALAVLAFQATPPVVPATCGIEFIHRPTGADVANYYPQAAFPQKLPGNTAINCVVASDLRLTQCVVTLEDPVGYGFGDATIKYFTINARGQAVDVNGVSCVGQHVKAHFRWQFS